MDVFLSAKFYPDLTRSFFSHMGEITHLRFGYYFMFFFVLPLSYSRGPILIFTQNTSKDAIPPKDAFEV